MHSTLSLTTTSWDEQVYHGERQLKEFSKFLQNYDNALTALLYKSVMPFDFNNEEISPRFSTQSRNNASLYQTLPPWSTKNNVISPMQQYVPIAIDYNYPAEKISTLELVATDNQCLNKMAAVFVQLCAEVLQLMEEGDVILLNCLYADEDLCQLYCDNEEQNDTPMTRLDVDLGNLTPIVILKLNKLLEFLCQTQYFLERCFVVISEIIKQLAALLGAQDQYYINVNYSALHFQSVFNYLAELAVLIIKFDNVFANGQIQRLWPNYSKIIRLIECNLDQLNTACLDRLQEIGDTSEEYGPDDITGLENTLHKLEFLFTGDLFQNLVDSLFQIKKQITSQALPVFSTHFQDYLKNTLNDIQKYAGNQNNNNINNPLPSTPSTNIILEILFSSSTDVIVEPSKAILKMNAMCILFHHIFGNLDQKVFSSLIECITKFPCITLLENIIWLPEKFLQRYAITLLPKVRGSADKISSANIERIQQNWLLTKCQRLTKDTQVHCVQVTTWILKMRNLMSTCGLTASQFTNADTNNIKIDELNQNGALILQGIQLMEKLSTTINSVTSLHVQLKCPMTKQSVLSICKLIEFLKIIKLTFTEYSSTISETAQSLAQYQIYQVLFLISPARKNLTAEVGNRSSSSRSSNFVYNERIIDTISALELAETALFGPPNLKRIITARLALSMTDPKRLFSSDQLTKLCRLFVSIEHFIQLPKTIQTLSASSFMYWHHNTMLPIYLKNALESNGGMDSERMLYLFHSSVDCQNELMNLNHVNFKCSTRFMEAMAVHLNRYVIGKLCGQIETILRIDVHANLQLLETNELDPFTTNISPSSGTSNTMTDICRLVELKPFHITTTQSLEPVEKFLIIRNHIGAYLSQMFYNLTTVSMHDWRTYGEMRYAAKQKFHLDTIEDHLPTQTLEQGLDVLEIMRNINSFVSNYLYNLNNQIFIEQSSNNKHLNTINIRHIANSLRTHGIGIINTTVNFTYQFLRKKFYIFSQFMYDEHIQSRLMKDLKTFRNENIDKTSEHQMYSYEKAYSFNRLIRQLGVSETGDSPLDLFRQLITHIGNAMGYVRMMRSGGINCCANASVFLPIVDENLEFISMCSRDGLSHATTDAATNLECDILHLRRNYSEGTEYFKLLVDAFSPFFRSEKNPHLKLFFLIVPPLTINYIEYIVNAKEKMNKKTKQQGTLFTDDGFAIGLAYVLELLNQTNEFKSLHWSHSVRYKYKMERERLLNDAKASSDSSKSVGANHQAYDAKLQQTLALSEKRINMIVREFELFFFNLNSAKIFFQ